VRGDDMARIKSPLFYFDSGYALYWIDVEKVSKGVQFLTRSKLFPPATRGYAGQAE